MNILHKHFMEKYIMIKLVVVLDNTNIACFNTELTDNVSSYNYRLKAM